MPENNDERKVSKTIINHFSEPLLKMQQRLLKRGQNSIMTSRDKERVYSPNYR